MATHSSVLAWRIPGTGEPGGLPSMGSHRVGHDFHFHFSLSCTGEGNGSPLQCSSWRIPGTGSLVAAVCGGAWWASVCGVGQSRTRLTRLRSSSSTRLHGPALTSVHDSWENHSLDWMDLCWQSDVEMYLSLQQVL